MESINNFGNKWLTRRLQALRPPSMPDDDDMISLSVWKVPLLRGWSEVLDRSMMLLFATGTWREYRGATSRILRYISNTWGCCAPYSTELRVKVKIGKDTGIVVLHRHFSGMLALGDRLNTLFWFYTSSSRQIERTFSIFHGSRHQPTCRCIMVMKTWAQRRTVEGSLRSAAFCCRSGE